MNDVAACPSVNVLSVCSGIGLLDLGIRLALPGASTICYVEREVPAAEILVARMEDGSLDDAPVWSDLTTFDGRPWRGVVDIVAGGIPCQPFSLAGKRTGNSDERALAPHLLRVVAECMPSMVLVENVPPWVSRGWARGFLDGLHDLGYDVAPPLYLTAEALGAPHRRERVFVMGYAERLRRPQPKGCLGNERRRDLHAGEALGDSAGARRTSDGSGCAFDPARQLAEGCGALADDDNAGRGIGTQQPQRERRSCDTSWIGHGGPEVGNTRSGNAAVGDANGAGLEDRRPDPKPIAFTAAWPPGPSADWTGIDERLWPATTQPALRRVAHGRAARLDRLRALGNGVVPLMVAAAFMALAERLPLRGIASLQAKRSEGGA